MRTLRKDVLYALRQLRLSPVFTLTAMLTLSLGIGATTAIFSLIHSVMLKLLPVANPASLYRVGDNNDCCVEGGPQGSWGLFPYVLYQRFAAAAPEFEQLAVFQAGGSQISVRRGEPTSPRSPCVASLFPATIFQPSDSRHIRAAPSRLPMTSLLPRRRPCSATVYGNRVMHPIPR